MCLREGSPLRDFGREGGQSARGIGRDEGNPLEWRASVARAQVAAIVPLHGADRQRRGGRRRHRRKEHAQKRELEAAQRAQHGHGAALRRLRPPVLAPVLPGRGCTSLQYPVS